MINLLLVEGEEMDEINIKQAFKKINNPLNMVSDGLEAVVLLRSYMKPVLILNNYWTISEIPLSCSSFVINP